MRTLCGIAVASLAFLILADCGHHTFFDSHTHIDVNQTPPAVVDGFNREFPGLKIANTDQIVNADKTVTYELKFRDAKNDYKRKLFGADGVLRGGQFEHGVPAAGRRVQRLQIKMHLHRGIGAQFMRQVQLFSAGGHHRIL